MMGTGYGGTGSFNYGINIGSTFVTSNVVTSGAGSIALTGFGGGSGASTDNVGVFLGQGLVQTGATGSISVHGFGGSTSTGTRNMGVRMFAFNTTQALGSGAITIWGRSGDGSTAAYNPGIDAAATVAGGGGPVTLTGIAGDAPGANNIGITAIGKVTNVGSGSVTIDGSGGSHAGATSSNNYGIGFSDALFSTVDGDLTVIGTAGAGGGAGNHGLVFPLAGVGGYGGTNAIRTTGSGNVHLVGVAGPGGTGIVESIANLVSTTGSGRILVEADSVALNAARAIVSASDLTIRPVTNGTSLVVGSGGPAGALTLGDGALANIDWASTGTLTLGGADSGAATVATGHVFAKPLVVTTGSGADLTLAAPLASTAAGSGPAIVLDAGRNFINTAGASAIDSGAAPWRVYSTDPAADARGGLVADFKQYDAAFGSTPVLGSGNGALYRTAPVLAIGLVGNVAKVYDGTVAAAPLPANFSVAGAIDGDTVIVASTGASYDSRDAGSAKAVSANGLSFGASNGATAVYGYRLAASDTTAAVGTIAPAPLVVRADDKTRVQGEPDVSLSATLVGFVAGETPTVLGGTLTLSTAAQPSSPPGGYAIVASGLSSTNYAIAYVDGLYQVLAAPAGPPVAAPSAPTPVATPPLVAAAELATFATQLAQRDRNVAGPPASGARCLPNALGTAAFVRALDRPLQTEPACAPIDLRPGSR